MTIEREYLRQHPYRFLNRVNDGASDPLVDDFRNGALSECKDRCTARHRLDHDQPEWLWPIDREQKRQRLAQEFGLAALIDFADELDSRVSWTRSSARSTLPDSEVANPRSCGTIARMSSHRGIALCPGTIGAHSFRGLRAFGC